jgi:hypothetical protein
MIYREGGPESKQGLTPFAVVTVAPSDRNTSHSLCRPVLPTRASLQDETTMPRPSGWPMGSSAAPSRAKTSR